MGTTLHARIFVAADHPHLTAEDVAAFLDRRLTATERHGIEDHLAHCGRCRAELAAVRRLVKSGPVPRQLTLRTGLAAAAVIAFLALTLGRLGSGGTDDRVRTPPSLTGSGSELITAIQPADGDTVATARPALIWRSIGGEPAYRVTITEETGKLVWTNTTTDTALTLPPTLLSPRTTYFWYVDALRADGRAASTGVHRFIVP
jgi:hypothetical protein